MISIHDVTKFREMCPAPLQLAIDLALLTRESLPRLLTLTWDHVEEEGTRFVRIKTRRSYLRVHTSDIKQVLLRARRMKPEVPRRYVIRRFNGTRFTVVQFRAVWREQMADWTSKGNPSFQFESIVRSTSISP